MSHLATALTPADGLAQENARLRAELQASRVRVVQAGHTARRQVERDLHDGAQQRLVSVALLLGLAERGQMPEAGRRQLICEARRGLRAALKELRELSRGLHPATLAERGLHDALRELADTVPVPVSLDVVLGGRLPAAVEAAAFFVISEALANVTRHAAARRVWVTVQRSVGHVLVAVADDGVGGARRDGGSGLRGLGDRVTALGGTLAVDSQPGRGTRLTVEIPCVS